MKRRWKMDAAPHQSTSPDKPNRLCPAESWGTWYPGGRKMKRWADTVWPPLALEAHGHALSFVVSRFENWSTSHWLLPRVCCQQSHNFSYISHNATLDYLFYLYDTYFSQYIRFSLIHYIILNCVAMLLCCYVIYTYYTEMLGNVKKNKKKIKAVSKHFPRLFL